MPKVYRKVEVGGYSEVGDYYEKVWKRVKLPFEDITPKEKACYVAGRAALVGLAAGIVWAAGTPGSKATETEKMQNARTNMRQAFDHMSDKDRYEAQYLSPAYIEATNIDSTGGRGILGALNDASPLTLRVGQACLAGSAFDTRSQNVYRGNTVSGVAALTYEDGFVAVHPAGNGSTALKFKSENGVLTPTADTIGSLRANNCNVDPGVPVFSDNSDSFYAPTDKENNFEAQLPLLP